ncbi:MAG: DUF2520 domain-containing protein, partial [Marinirhabdus sp.]
DGKILQQLGGKISENVRVISSKKRATLHLAAVFVNNFVNHLYAVSAELLKKEGIAFSLLEPLIAETASKIKTHMPAEAQTGPAIRNDIKTIERHVELLRATGFQAIYEQLTEAIRAKR